MFSQANRFFSQEGEISQLVSPLISDQTTEQNHESNTEGGDTEVVHPQADYQAHSRRADAVCNQNRQLRGYLESNLKQIEKKRIKLSNKIKEIEEQINIWKDKSKYVCQSSVESQMSLEEVSENYQNELNGRGNLKEKLDHVQIVMNYFVHQHSEITKVSNDFKKEKQQLKFELEKLYSDLKAKVEEKNKLKLSYKAAMREQTLKAQNTAECYSMNRERYINQIGVLLEERSINLNNHNSLQENIGNLLNKRKESNELFMELTHHKKSMKENLARLHNQGEELNTTTVTAIQNLKLQIINEQNENSKLEVKCEENDKFINVISKKEKELLNLYNQMNEAIDKSTKRKEEIQKNIDEYKDKKIIVSDEIKKLEKDIKEFENCEKVHELLSNDIRRLEETNTVKEIALQDKQRLIDNISQEQQQLNKLHDDIAFDIQNLSIELETATTHENDLTTKLEEQKLKNQTDREAKLLNNKSIEQLNLENASKVKELTTELEEARSSNNNVESDKMKISSLITDYLERKLEADRKLTTIQFELEDKCKTFENSIHLKNNTLNELKKLIIDARPYQEELLKLTSRKQELKEQIQEGKDNYNKETDIAVHNFNSKVTEINREAEKYKAILEGIIKDKDEAIEGLKEKISKADAVRMSNETELNSLFQRIKDLKHAEQFKRSFVVKLEKRMKTIQKEITFTHEEMKGVVAENMKSETQKWAETSLPQDEYEYSEV